MRTINEKNEKLVENFRLELAKIYESTRSIVKNSKSKEKMLIRFNDIAKEFYTKFKNTSIPVILSDSVLSTSFELFSASIMLPYGSLKIPFFFIEVLQDDINFSFNEEFSQELEWMDLIGVLYQKWYNTRKKLTKTIVLICKVLSRNGIDGQLYRFPLTYEMIANRTRQSLSIIKLTFSSDTINSIVKNYFLFNPWKLGWEIYLLSYPITMNEKLTSYDNVTIAQEYCSHNNMFRIIQQPSSSNNERLLTLKSNVRSIGGRIYFVNALSYHWDLSQLHPRPEKSFVMRPYFFVNSPSIIKPNITYEIENQSLDWIKRTIDEKNKYDPEKRKKIIEVLATIIEFGISNNDYEGFANEKGLDSHELNDIFHFLLENKVLALAYNFNFIGAGRDYFFLIENSDEKLNNLLKQNLLQCTFSYFWESQEMIAGRLKVPDIWVANLLEFFTRLQYQNPLLEISYGQCLYGYSLFNPNIKLSRKNILNILKNQESLEKELVT